MLSKAIVFKAFKMLTNRTSQSGFTSIEVMIVVAIIGLLAEIGLVNH